MAKVSVKLVAEAGIGTVASGVAKGNADIIQVILQFILGLILLLIVTRYFITTEEFNQMPRRITRSSAIFVRVRSLKNRDCVSRIPLKFKISNLFTGLTIPDNSFMAQLPNFYVHETKEKSGSLLLLRHNIVAQYHLFFCLLIIHIGFSLNRGFSIFVP